MSTSVQTRCWSLPPHPHPRHLHDPQEWDVSFAPVASSSSSSPVVVLHGVGFGRVQPNIQMKNHYEQSYFHTEVHLNLFCYGGGSGTDRPAPDPQQSPAATLLGSVELVRAKNNN